MGEVLATAPCPKCRAVGRDRSGDNLKQFPDGQYCFACGYLQKSGEGVSTVEAKQKYTKPEKKTPPLVTEGLTFQALQHRGISAQTCRKYGYGLVQSQRTQQVFEVAPYFDEHNILVSQKMRLHKGKKMFKTGDGRQLGFFGRQIVPPNGKILVVTQGQIDAMSVYQANDLKFPAVSIPDGASGAQAVFRRQTAYLNSFQRVVIMFDNDKPGQAAAKACAKVLRPGKAYIATLPRKDANQHLVANQKAVIRRAIWQAQPWRPDGIVHIKDVQVTRNNKQGHKIFTHPFNSLTKATYGRRAGCVDVLTSGSGMGKSTYIRQMIYHDLTRGNRVGAIMLQQSVRKTKQDIMSIHVQKPIHKILAAEQINRDMLKNGYDPINFGILPQITDEQFNAATEWMAKQDLFVFDHFGSLQIDVLTERIQYLKQACECDVIYLDHVSIVVSGNESNDERRDLDRLMTHLKSLAQRTQVMLTAVCHLKKPNGTAFEQGGQISLNDLRGSGALYQLADTVIGFQRNQQDDDKDKANTIRCRILKDRFGGNTGLVSAMRFDHSTQRLNQLSEEQFKQLKDSMNGT